MKKSKKLILGAIAMVFGLSLASCGEEEDRFDEVVDTTGNADIDMITTQVSTSTFSSISCVTTNAKTHFYVGEEFTIEGLVVKANYVVTVDGSPTSQEKEISTWYYDLDDVDMGQIGKYSVNITYRENEVVRKTTYRIEVTSSYLDDLGIEYLAGIEPVNSIISISKNAAVPITKDSFTMHYMKSAANDRPVELSDADFDKMEIDFEAVDVTKTGTYTVTYSYSSSVTLEDGTLYEYVLNGFILVKVA